MRDFQAIKEAIMKEGCHTGGTKGKKALWVWGLFFLGGGEGNRGKGKLVRLQELTLGTHRLKNTTGDL